MIYLVGAFLFGCMIFGIGRSVYWSFDHLGWNNVARPDADAQINNFTSEQVKYEKNGAKFKTTVTFTDGFYYITHKTNSERHVLSYTISIDDALKAEIIKKAIEKHQKAVEKVYFQQKAKISQNK